MLWMSVRTDWDVARLTKTAVELVLNQPLERRPETDRGRLTCGSADENIARGLSLR